MFLLALEFIFNNAHRHIWVILDIFCDRTWTGFCQNSESENTFNRQILSHTITMPYGPILFTSCTTLSLTLLTSSLKKLLSLSHITLSGYYVVTPVQWENKHTYIQLIAFHSENNFPQLLLCPLPKLDPPVFCDSYIFKLKCISIFKSQC